MAGADVSLPGLWIWWWCLATGCLVTAWLCSQPWTTRSLTYTADSYVDVDISPAHVQTRPLTYGSASTTHRRHLHLRKKFRPHGTNASARSTALSGTSSAAGTGHLHVALAFYGLTRSLNYTIDSIKLNILDRLAAADIRYYTYLHTYDLVTYTNKRSSEANQALNTSEWQLLNPDRVRITSQHDFDHEYGQARAACRRTGDVYENNFATITNLFYQLNSIRIVTQMWRTSRTPYDAVLYLRPDLLYNCPLPVHLLGSLAPDTWYVVNNHHFAGVNDRFLMARPAEAELWGNRLYFTLVTCTRSQIHSESQVLRLAAYHGVRAHQIPFSAYRVRSTGLLEPHDYSGADCIAQCDPAMFEPFVQREADLLASGAIRPLNETRPELAVPCRKLPLCQLVAPAPQPRRSLVARMGSMFWLGPAMARLWAPKECYQYPLSSCRNCSLLEQGSAGR